MHDQHRIIYFIFLYELHYGSSDALKRFKILIVEQAPDIKKMEATIRTYFREGKVDMAFMVMISMNLQRVS